MLWGIFGRRGTGKTELAKHASYHLADNGGLVFVFDPVRQWPAQYQRSINLIDSIDYLPRLNALGNCEPEEVFERACIVGNCICIADEMDLLCSSASWKSESARAVVRRGRHYRVALIATAQRFANVHGDFLALADRLSIFRSTHLADLERIDKALGAEYATAVESLAEYHWIDWPSGKIQALLK